MINKTTLVGLISGGLFFSLLLSGLMLQYEFAEVEDEFNSQYTLSTSLLKRKIQKLIVADDKLRFLFQTNESVSDDDFLVNSQALLSQFAHIKKVVYAPKIRKSHIEIEERLLQHDGYTGFRFHSFSGQQSVKSQFPEVIFPVRLIQPYTPYTSVWFGLDLLTFKPAKDILKEVFSTGNKMQIVLPESGGEPVFYAFSAVSFLPDNGDVFNISIEDVSALLGYELDLIGLLSEDAGDINREVQFNGTPIMNDSTSGRTFLELSHIDIIHFEGQNIWINYRYPSPLRDVDYRLPVLILMLGILITMLLFSVVKNNLERQAILRDQNRLIEKKVKQKTALLEDQAKQISRAFDNQIAVTKELESFSYSISHDLRAPLRSISGFANALYEDYGDKFDDEGKDMLIRVEKGAEKMSVLIDDLLSLSKISRQDFKFEKFSISDLVSEQLADICGDSPYNNIAIKQVSNLEAEGDRNLVRIVITNLLSNAIKYSANVDNPEIEFGVIERDNKPVYFVRDNGIGFDMAYANKLFIAFQRLHGPEFDGTGIGLATVQRIINRHGGKVWAESEPGRGSTFFFSLN